MIFRRFAAVGILSTTVDVGILCALRLGAGIPVIFAYAVSITAAAAVSYSPHRAVTIPAYGEQEHIGETIAIVRQDLDAIAGDGGVEIVVVDDGSADATAERARVAGADHVLVQPQNRGKGAAVRAGVLAARGRTVAFT